MTGLDFEITDASGHVELETLSRRYAAAMDRRDRAALLGVFHLEATMRVEQPGQPVGRLAGHRELGRLTDIIAGWPLTRHVLAQGLFVVDGDSAVGETYCTAHHFHTGADGRGNDHVMHIRYRDQYASGADMRWLITHRTVLVEAIENHTATFEIP